MTAETKPNRRKLFGFSPPIKGDRLVELVETREGFQIKFHRVMCLAGYEYLDADGNTVEAEQVPMIDLGGVVTEVTWETGDYLGIAKRDETEGDWYDRAQAFLADAGCAECAAEGPGVKATKPNEAN
jgi:hypothetical protein